MYKIRNSKILITGGAGFIGSNLANSLVEENEIVIVDDLSMGKLQNLPTSKNIHFFHHSIVDSNFMEDLLINWDFDYIFLLAAVASVADTIARPMTTHQINQDANLNILETLRVNKLSPSKILFASSAAVYGNNPELPKSEKSPIEPLTPYAIDKFATERFLVDYGQLYGLKTVCTRFFNVYGPNQNPESPYSGVLSLIADCIQHDKRFSVLGDGEQTRDFVYVGDVVDALEKLMTNDKALHTVFNIGTGVSTSLNSVISALEAVSGKKLQIQYKEKRSGDIQNSVASVEKANKLLGLKKTSIQDGLKLFWNNLVMENEK